MAANSKTYMKTLKYQKKHFKIKQSKQLKANNNIMSCTNFQIPYLFACCREMLSANLPILLIAEAMRDKMFTMYKIRRQLNDRSLF